MKQLTILLLLLIAANQEIWAQGQPLYICDTSKPKIDTLIHYWQPFDLAENLTQSIYYKSDFPTMPPQGFITDIFMKIGYNTPAGSTIPGLTVKMGITSMNDYATNFAQPQFLSMDSTLTTVFYDSFYVTLSALSAGSWWKLSLPQPYQYSMLPLPGDIPQNLVVQLSKSIRSSTSQTWKFNIDEIIFSNKLVKRGLRANRNNNQIILDGTAHFVTLIGFNGYALSVDDPQKKIPFSVFPNPATDKLHVSKDVSGMYEVYDLRGVKVAAGKINEGEEVNVQNLVPGMYLLRMGERNTRFMKK